MLTEKINQHYQLVIKKAKSEYGLLKSVYCPCLKETIHFNTDGFHHLRFEISGRERSKTEQIYKLNLIPLIIPVIKNATKIDEYRTNSVRIGRKKKALIKNVEYWAMIAIVGLGNTKTKVILRRVGTGKIVFWSIMKLTKQKRHL